MDIAHFYGMEFLKPAVETAAYLNWFFVIFSLMVFVVFLQALATIFSAIICRKMQCMRGQEYRQHILFLVAQLLALIFVSAIIAADSIVAGSGTFALSRFSFFCFSVLLTYFCVVSLSLYRHISIVAVSMTIGVSVVICGITIFLPSQIMHYSFVCVACLHCILSFVSRSSFNRIGLMLYRVIAIAIVFQLLMQELNMISDAPKVFCFLLFALGVIQWMLTLAHLWRNYAQSIDDRDEKQRYFAEEDRRRLEAIFVDLHDEVTGCPNDGYLVNYLNNAVFKGKNKEFALFCVRVRGLRSVQNALGIETANGLLKACAQRLAVIGYALDDFISISSHDNALGCVIRSEGREFFMVSRNTSSDAMSRYCDKINETFSIPFEYGGLCLDLQANIGIALYPAHGERAQQVMQYANVAVDIAKRGSYRSVLFDPLLDPGVQRRLTLLGDLRGALNRGDIYLTYQPQMCLATNQILGVEALIRWSHSFLGEVSPNEFIVLAEQTGMIKHISRWICDHAAMDFVRLNLEGFCLKMSINVSPNNLLEDNFASAVLSILEKYDIPSDCFCVELTETAMMLDPQRVMASIEHMTRHGIIFSIDDFGTGFSSLVNLKRLKVKQLKIDKDFIANLEFDTEDEAIVRAIIEMANCLGLQTVAEGVESLAVLEKLRVLECNIIQGFFVAKSMVIDDLIEWLVSRPNQTEKIQHLVS